MVAATRICTQVPKSMKVSRDSYPPLHYTHRQCVVRVGLFWGFGCDYKCERLDTSLCSTRDGLALRMLLGAVRVEESTCACADQPHVESLVHQASNDTCQNQVTMKSIVRKQCEMYHELYSLKARQVSLGCLEISTGSGSHSYQIC
jgi:hypothetical protein